MDINTLWEKALKKTEIIRHRIQPLSTFEPTKMPYVFLAESMLNSGDTLIRKGELMVEKPAIILPSHSPQFEGFESEELPQLNMDVLTNFLLVRGVHFPSLKYNNITESLDIFEGSLQQAIEKYSKILQRQENTSSGLLIGPEDCWQFSVLILACSCMSQSAEKDIKRLLDRYKKGE